MMKNNTKKESKIKKKWFNFSSPNSVFMKEKERIDGSQGK